MLGVLEELRGNYVCKQLCSCFAHLAAVSPDLHTSKPGFPPQGRSLPGERRA